MCVPIASNREVHDNQHWDPRRICVSDQNLREGTPGEKRNNHSAEYQHESHELFPWKTDVSRVCGRGQNAAANHQNQTNERITDCATRARRSFTRPGKLQREIGAKHKGQPRDSDDRATTPC